MCHAPVCVIDSTIDWISTTPDDSHSSLVHEFEIGVEHNKWCSEVQGAVSASALDGSVEWTSDPFSYDASRITVTQTSHFATTNFVGYVGYTTEQSVGARDSVEFDFEIF
jgi:hypothetical protein